MMSLVDAPLDSSLRILDVTGGHGIRRRLMALGLHRHDIIELDSRSVMGGPLRVHNITTDAVVGLGRGVAQHILVEAIDEKQ